MIKYLPIIFLVFIFNSCKDKVSNETVVYQNDFEFGNLSSIQNGVISQFNASSVLGNYNNQNFILSVKNLPGHDLVTITFDLFIHDQWDGNKNAPDGPDIWQLLVDGNSYIYTTFSNSPCGANTFCPPQAYPHDYPNNNQNPKAGAYRTDLPGFCSMQGVANWTTLYKISKTFKHTSGSLTLECLDKLVQTNTPDPKCDESWSVDNIVIKTIKL